MADLLASLQAAAGATGETDENFANTVLLLHGDGNQGATNFSNAGPPVYLAFKDNSSNNFPITVNGDAYGDNFGPFALDDGYWSNYFDGSGDYLTSSSSNAITPTGTQDFCIEFFAFVQSVPGIYGIIVEGSTTSNGFQIAYINDGGADQNRIGVAASGVGLISKATFNTYFNQWVHLAFTRSGNNHRVFINGVLQGYVSNSISFASRTTQSIGAQAAGTFGIAGYISSIRTTPGTIPTSYQTSNTTVGTTIFSPPTTPLTTTSQGASSPTFLSCQSNRFVDNSTNNFAITRNGDVKVQVFNPFGELPDGVNGSGYFDGTTDDLTVSSNAALQLASESNWTVEFWGYFVSSPSDFDVILGKGTGSGSYEYFFEGFSDNTIDILYSADGTTTWTGQHQITPVIPNGQWFHLAAVRNGATFKSYVNGVEYFSGSSFNIYAGSGVLNIGGYSGAAGQDPNMYLSNVRIVKGTAVYTSDFTPPTAPLTNITNTSLLTCQYAGTVRNVGFIDSGPYDFPITRVGNTTQGTFSPFSAPDGRWSNYFDGTGDYLDITDNGDLDFGTGAFTIEAWIYSATGLTTSNLTIVDARPVAAGAATGNYYFFVNSSAKLVLGTQNDSDSPPGFNVASTASLSPNQWTHVVAARDGNTVRLFINGALDSSHDVTGKTYNAAIFRIGNGTATGTSLTFWNGYLASLRCVKGTAVYTSAFTPSTSPLTAISGTELLTCQSNRFVDNSSNNFAITRNGDVKVTPFSPFAPTAAYSPSVNGGSMYAAGNGNYLYTSSSVGLGLGTQTWTISCWCYESTTTGFHFLSISPNTSNVSSFSIEGANRRPVLQIYTGGTNRVLYHGVTNSIITNQWNHVALCHLGGGQYQFYVNGTAQTASSATGYYFNSAGASASGTGINVYAYNNLASINGYLSDLVVKDGIDGSVPTAPITTPPANTSLLCNFTNAGIFDNTGKNNLETVGNAQIDTTVKKYGTGSMEFDGTGDVLIVPYNQDINISSGDFTLEAWVYYTNATSFFHVFAMWDASNLMYQCYIATSNNSIEFSTSSNGSTSTALTSSSSVISPSTWTHLAIVRSAGTVTVYVNGSSVASGARTIFNGTSKLSVGGRADGSFYGTGFVDDLRITKGVARYTSNFTPPTAAFPNL